MTGPITASLAHCQPDKIIPYKSIGGESLELHAFFPPGHQASDCRPAIVLFFGGGWRGGTTTQFYPQCRYLASRGMVAFSADYRVESRHGTSPIECVADGKSAVRWIRGHADELGVDPGRLSAGGGSAGGHVAATAGTTSSLDEPGEDLSISSRPDALVLFNPVIDTSPAGYGSDRLGPRWREISPLHHISKEAPPAIIFLGSEDDIIPVATAEAFKQRMTEAGVLCEVRVYPGQPHGFFNYRDGSNPYYSATLFEADRFLTHQGFLDGEPTVEKHDVNQMVC